MKIPFDSDMSFNYFSAFTGNKGFLQYINVLKPRQEINAPINNKKLAESKLIQGWASPVPFFSLSLGTIAIII